MGGVELYLDISVYDVLPVKILNGQQDISNDSSCMELRVILHICQPERVRESGSQGGRGRSVGERWRWKGYWETRSRDGRNERREGNIARKNIEEFKDYTACQCILYQTAGGCRERNSQAIEASSF